MDLKRLCFLMAACVAINSLTADETYCECSESRFYLKLDSGVSFARELKVTAPLGFWDTSQQGYNDKIGNRPILGLGVGYEFSKLLSLDLTLSFRPQYKYRKFQIPIPGTAAPGFLGTKTREFDLDIGTLMLSGYVSGRGWDLLCWQLGDSGTIYPIIGGGIGISRVAISNFRAFGLPPVDAAIDPIPSFGSSSDYAARYCFCYQLSAGLEYRYCDAWAIGVGYRWFDLMKFKGPRFLRDPSGVALDIGPNEMRLKFAAHELYVEFKLFF